MQGVVFDFNGTLFWDTDKNEHAWRRFVLRHMGREVADAEFHALHGVPNEETIEYFLKRKVEPDEARALSVEKESYYYEACLADPQGMRLAPGANEMLDELSARGIARAIATSANHDNLAFYFKHFDLGRWFDRSNVVYSDGTLASKPAPDFYLEAARRLNLSPGVLVAVEDSHSGMKAAQAAGFARLVGMDASGSAFDDIAGVVRIRDFNGWRDWFYDG